MGEITPIGGQIPFPKSGSPQSNFVLQLSRINQEFRRALSDYDAGGVPFTQIHAAAYNVYCFLQDNHAWLQSGSQSLGKGTLEKVTTLLYPHNTSDEKEAIGNFRSASDTIQNDMTSRFFQNGS